MTEDEQKRIFARNLSYFISMTGKRQKEVAKDIGIIPSTFNTWCKGNLIPNVRKLQKIADYFGIDREDLLDADLDLSGKTPEEIQDENYEMGKIYQQLHDKDKKFVRDMMLRIIEGYKQ